MDEKGQPIFDAEKKTLLDRVEFHESDLLAYCRDNDIQLERIVGCIPQVQPLYGTSSDARLRNFECRGNLHDWLWNYKNNIKIDSGTHNWLLLADS